METKEEKYTWILENGKCKSCGAEIENTEESRVLHLEQNPTCAEFHGAPVALFPVISLRALDKIKFPPQKFLVNRLVKRNALNLLIAKRGHMKTYFACSLTLAVVKGERFLGTDYGFDTEPTEVVYLDGENGLPELIARFRCLSNGAELPENVIISAYPSGRLDGEMDTLREFFEKHRGALVICDSYKRFVRFAENETDAMNAFLVEKIQPLINEFDLTFLFLHHFRKGIGRGQPDDWQDEARGSSELINFSYSTFMLEKRGTFLVLRHLKARSGGLELEDQRVEIAKQGDFLTLTNAGRYEEIAALPEKAALALKKWLFTGPATFKTEDAKTALKGQFHPKAIGRALKLLVDGGVLQRPSRGQFEVIRGKLTDFGDEGTKGQKGQEQEGKGENEA